MPRWHTTIPFRRWRGLKSEFACRTRRIDGENRAAIRFGFRGHESRAGERKARPQFSQSSGQKKKRQPIELLQKQDMQMNS